MIKIQLSMITWTVFLMLVLLYMMISACDSLWNWIESANPSTLFLSGLVGFPTLFGFLSHFVTSRYIPQPLLIIPVVPIVAAIGTDLYTTITYSGPHDNLGLTVYSLKLVEAFCVFLGVGLALLCKKVIRDRLTTGNSGLDR